MRGGLRALLLASGLEVVAEADNGADIIELVAELRPDVVLMDLEMPGVGGVAATIALVERDPKPACSSSPCTPTMIRSSAPCAPEPADIWSRAPTRTTSSVRCVGSPKAKSSSTPRSLNESSPSCRSLAFSRRFRHSPAASGKSSPCSPMVNDRVIAQRLGVSSKTVANHVSNVFAKLHLADHAQAVIRARDAGLGHT